MLSQLSENMLGVLVVEFQIVLSVDTQVIYIDLQPLFSNHVSEDVVHECLKGWGALQNPKNMMVGL